MADSTHGEQQYPQIGLSGPAAATIADLVSLSRDIQFAHDCALTYANNSENRGQHSADDQFLMQAVWSAGAISYRRAFASGKGHLVKQGGRLKFKDGWTDELEAGMAEAHERLLELANKHIAHRVGDHEGVVVTAVFDPESEAPKVVGIGQMLVHMVGPTPEFAHSVVALCGVVSGAIERELKRVTDAAMAALNQSNDLEEMYAAAVKSTSGEQSDL